MDVYVVYNPYPIYTTERIKLFTSAENAREEAIQCAVRYFGSSATYNPEFTKYGEVLTFEKQNTRISVTKQTIED